MLAGDCTKGASALCFLCQRRQTILGRFGIFFKICTFQIAGNARSSPPFCFFHAACQESSCYYGQPELTCRPIIHILTGESPEETRKLVAHEKIKPWPKFSASEGMNSEFMSTSERLKGRVTFEKSANA